MVFVHVQELVGRVGHPPGKVHDFERMRAVDFEERAVLDVGVEFVQKRLVRRLGGSQS